MQTSKIPIRRRFPRLTTWLILTVILLITIGAISPIQLPVVVYKLSLISLAAVAAYWLDRGLFPYARPDGYLDKDWRYGSQADQYIVDYPIADGYEKAFLVATIRRAIIVCSVVIAAAVGL